MFGFGVARGKRTFCSIECARHHGVEPDRMLMHFEYAGGECAGCNVPLDLDSEVEEV